MQYSTVSTLFVTGVGCLALSLIAMTPLAHSHDPDDRAQALKKLRKLEPSIPTMDLFDNHIGLKGPKIRDAELTLLRPFGDLKGLSLIGTSVTDEGLGNILKHLNKLTELGLDGTKVGDNALVHIGRLVDIEWLHLDGTSISDAGLSHISGLSNLTFLSLRDTQVGDAGMVHLKELTSLDSLWLSDTRVTDAGLKHLEGLTQLRHLLLKNTRISDAGLRRLGKLRNLKTLGMSGTHISGSGLAHLKELKDLRDLYLDNTEVDSAGLAHLKKHEALISLHIRNTRVDASGLEHLLDLPHLPVLLAYEGTSITETDEAKALFRSASFRKNPTVTGIRQRGGNIVLDERDATLRITMEGKNFDDTEVELLRGGDAHTSAVSFKGSRITDKGLLQLCKYFEHGKLFRLDLSKTLITDAGLSGVRLLQTLTWLDLSGTQITDKGLVDLRKATNLKELILSGTKTTSEGVTKLRQSLPEVTIIWSEQHP